MPGMVSSRSSHTPSVGSLFSRYPSRLAWSRRGLLIRLTWVRCSRGICHAWHCLIVVFSHTLRGFVVLYGVGGRSAGSRVERGRSVERDNMRLQSICFTLQVICAPPRHTTPMGLPSFPSAENVFAPRKQNSNTMRDTLQKHSSNETLRQYKGNSSRSILLRTSSFRLCDFLIFEGTEVWFRRV